MADFNDLLFQAEKLANDLEGNDELPKVDRSLRQVLEASNELYARVAQSGAQDIQANLLLGSKGIDLPQISQKLENLITKKTFEPLEPIADSDIHTFLKNETESAVLKIISEVNERTLSQVQELQWEYIDNEWDQEKYRLLSAMTGPSEEFLDLDRSARTTALPEVPSPSPLSLEETLFAREIMQYNKFVMENNKKASLVDCFAKIAKEFQDAKVNELWDILKYMLNIPPLPRSKDPLINRSTPPGSDYMIKAARTYLEDRYKTFMNNVIADDLQNARRGGIPGTYHLVRSFVSLRFHGDYLGLQDGLIDDRPLWPMIYFCIRCGDLKAALQCIQKADVMASEDLQPILEEYCKGSDMKKIAMLESKIKFQYRRSVRNNTDPFKRIVYCILGCCDVADEHSEVAQTADDYLWLKLTLIRDDADGEKLTYGDLQTNILEYYGESHYQAHKQPHLYFQVLALTGQFEAAIEFLSRVDRYRVHAVHMAIALNEVYLLALPRDVQSPLLSVDPADLKPGRRLNFVRLIMLYVHRFEITNPSEAIQYFFVLRNLVNLEGHNLFAVCVSDLALECRDYDRLFGKIQSNGARMKGLVDQFSAAGVNTQLIAEMVADQLHLKGLFTDAIKLYDLAHKHEQVLKLMSTMLSQVVQLQPIAGSSRERLQILAEEIAFRYVGDSFKCSRQIYTTFHILKDLLNFFDHYHNNQHVLALEAMQRLQIIPLSMDEVEEKVANFKNLDTEVCRVLPDILLATMNILHKRYMHIQEGSDGNRGRFDESERASQLHFLRDQLKALTSFAGTIPYRLPGDTNVRLVQMEILMH